MINIETMTSIFKAWFKTILHSLLLYIAVDGRPPLKRRRKICHDFLNIIDQTGRLHIYFPRSISYKTGLCFAYPISIK